MTPLQRYRATLDGKPPDHPPRIPILMQFAAEYIGSNYAAFASDHRVLVQANAACARDFGLDQLSCISDPYRETAAFGGLIEYIHDGVPRCSHPLADNPDLAKLLPPHPLQSPRMLDRILAARLYRQRFGEHYSILGWVEGPAAEAADLRDLANFMIDLLDDEPYACQLMDRCLQVAIDFALAQIHAGCDTIGIGDALASQVSPDTYQRLIQPREKKLIQSIHAAGANVRLHICGNITHLLPAIADLNVDILDVDHMVNLQTARQTLGHRVTLAGNVDPASIVRFGTPHQIRQKIRESHDHANGPFMIAAGCEIPAGTPIENLHALCGDRRD